MKLIIDIPEEIMEYVKNNGCLSVVYDDEVAKAIINGTPYEDRPQGKWIYHKDWYRDGECPWECSECGTCYDYEMNYCGECGAQMSEDEA